MNDPTNRIEGRLKVTGAARFPTETAVSGVAHAVLVQSTIARGRILAIDSSAAQRVPGFLAIVTHFDAPKLRVPPAAPPGGGPGADPNALRLPEGKGLLQDDVIHYSGQHIAIVVGDTLEQARAAAALVQVHYVRSPHQTDFDAHIAQARAPNGRGPGVGAEPRGDADAALAGSAIVIDANYSTPTEHHNPMGLFGCIAHWEAPDRLLVHDTTQGVYNTRAALAAGFGLPVDNVRVVSTYVGGAFGAALRAWPHPTLVAMAAKRVGRPVKLLLTRRQMFTSNGYRNPTRQRLAIASTPEGKLSAIVHEAISPTNRFQEFGGGTTRKTLMMYDCPNVRVRERLVELDLSKATPMRAPGSAEGAFALESAMDELAYRIGVDPLELRLQNFAERDPDNGRPWSSNSLRECYREGAARFGWSRRNPQPGATRDGRLLVGYGMAAAAYEARRQPASARVILRANGQVLVENAGTDIGPGTYTALALVAAEAVGVEVGQVEVRLADTNLPAAPVQGGSFLLASTANAVNIAAEDARTKLLALAQRETGSPFTGLAPGAVRLRGGRLVGPGRASKGVPWRDLLIRNGLQTLEGLAERAPTAGAGSAARASSEQAQGGGAASGRAVGPEGPRGGVPTRSSPSEGARYSSYSFGAHFIEVKVDPELGEVRVSRVAGAYSAGRIINPKAARSQVIGGIVGGLGMALMEETRMDHRVGRYTNTSIADYLVPVHADVPAMDIALVDEVDPHVNPLGIKGIGELPIVGVAAAVANAVFHATGKRIRDLPITPEKLLERTGLSRSS
jgi:xanthine dehydrogenase YagR molybdenum-binding subunit